MFTNERVFWKLSIFFSFYIAIKIKFVMLLKDHGDIVKEYTFFLLGLSILYQPFFPHITQWNGKAKRKNRHAIDITYPLLLYMFLSLGWGTYSYMLSSTLYGQVSFLVHHLEMLYIPFPQGCWIKLQDEIS